MLFQNAQSPDSHMTQIVDDNTGDDVRRDLCQPLQANRGDDLHIANTRFFRHKPIDDPTSGPEFTSAPKFRPASRSIQKSTNLNASNFSPDLTTFSTEIAHLDSSNSESTPEAMSRPAGPIPPFLTEDIETDADTASHLQGNAESDSALKGSGRKVNIEVPLYSKCKTDGPSSMLKNLLTVPEDGRNVHSPVPLMGEDDTDLDPFEGMDIPRERVCSFGSSSIYSVKEISDRLYQEYFFEVRNSIRNYGFFEKFPTPAVVSDAQRAYRQMEIPTPADEEGNILPHPPKITKEDVFASMTESYTEVDQRIINVS